MIQLKLQTREDLDTRIAHRTGEVKLGERASVITALDDLKQHRGKYVVFGICEDIGVQANYGKRGTAEAWDAFLNAFINVQYQESEGAQSDIIILGYISVTPNEKISKDTSKIILGNIVERIDKKVSELVQRIVEAGKIPIIIGGGHNNAFGNLKGSAQALQSPINAINIDAHTDLRTADYRHSGNGFTYALENPEGSYLEHYTIFGLAQNYTPQYIFDYMKREKNRISYFLLEEMLTVAQQYEAFNKALVTVSSSHFGIEVDCDSIAHFPSSAQTPSGLTLETVRVFIKKLGASKNSTYLHICEAAPKKKNAGQVGKALTFLVTDFIHSHRDHHSI